MTTNLSGSLSEFSLAEVLSLLGMGGRTARMQVTSADAVGSVHLVDGGISSATADSSRAGLLRSLVAALPVPADDLASALQADDPVRALVESGVVDREAAGQVAAEHCTEAIGTMLEWTSGEFAVWVGSQDPSDIGVRLEVDELVGAARDRSQEWHDLRVALPAPESVLALVPEVAAAPVVDSDDWAVLARVDGRRTLAEVLAALGASPLVAGNRLVQLMGRGLVAVQVRGGNAEVERSQHMIDEFEAGPVDEVVELVASTEPAFAPEIHDLFETPPGAVEEWQSAGVDSWAVAAPEPAFAEAFEGAVESSQFEVLPVGFAAEPVRFDVEVPSFDIEGVELERVPVAYDLDPVPDEPDPAFFASDPVVYEPEVSSVEPEVPVVAPPALEVQPAAEPVAEAEPAPGSFAWSPWAQEMGLGEAPPVAEAALESAVGRGFTDMVEDGAGQGHTDAYPVPQAPVAGSVDGYDPALEYGGVDEVAQFVPQPRDAADGLVVASAQVPSVGAHAADPEYMPASGMQSGAEVDQPTQESAPDPLAGGLLAQLMSSVRGL